jgi:hypothetical protein
MRIIEPNYGNKGTYVGMPNYVINRPVAVLIGLDVVRLFGLGKKDASPVSRRGMDSSNRESAKASPSFSKNAEAPGIAALMVYGWGQSHVHTD